MNEIQDVKDSFGNCQWEDRVNANPLRIYAFLLGTATEWCEPRS